MLWVGNEKKISIFYPFPGINTRFRKPCAAALLGAKQRTEKEQSGEVRAAKQRAAGRETFIFSDNVSREKKIQAERK